MTKLIGLFYQTIRDATEKMKEMTEGQFVIVRCGKGYLIVSKEVAIKNKLEIKG